MLRSFLYSNSCFNSIHVSTPQVAIRHAATRTSSIPDETVTIAGLLTGRGGSRSKSNYSFSQQQAAPASRRSNKAKWWATPGFAVGSIALADAFVYLGWRFAFSRPKMMDVMERNFTSSYNNLSTGRLWTLLTSTVSHAELGQLLANLNAVYSCGLPLAQIIGPKKFFAIYSGGALISSLSLITVDYFKSKKRKKMPESQPILGGSGAATALLTAFAVAYPHSVVLVNGYVRLPVIIEALATAVYDLANIGKETQTGVSHSGHFAGAVFGALSSLLFLRSSN